MWHPNTLAFRSPVYYPAIKSNSWETLDLSKGIGSEGVFLAKLVVVVESGSPFVSFRPRNNGANFDDTSGAAGVMNVNPVTGEAATVEVCTNDKSKIEWKSDGISSVALYLEGYLDVTAQDPLATSPQNETIPIAPWPGNTVNLSAISNDDTLFMTQVTVQVAPSSSNAAMRASDDADDLMGVGGLSSASGGTNRFFVTNGKSYGMLIPSNNTGRYQHINSGLAPVSVAVFVHCFVNTSNGWVRSRSSFTGLTPPTSGYADLDLSSIIGERTAYVLLKINRPGAAGSGTFLHLATRQPNSLNTDEYLFASQLRQAGSQAGCIDAQKAVYLAVATDPRGVIEWKADSATYPVDVTVMGYILGGLINIVDGTFPTRNTVEIEFDKEPKHVDPTDPASITNPDNWTITKSPTPENDRLIQIIEYIGDNTVRLSFDGPLDKEITYSFLIENIESVDDEPILPATSPQVVLFSYDREDDAAEPIQPTDESYDLANPQTASTAGANQSLGTYQVTDEGDLENDFGRTALKKRIFRRITTRPGGFFHLPGYGVDLREGQLITPTSLRRLQTQIESQVREEPEVISAIASVAQLSPGIVRITLTIKDSIGTFRASSELDLTEAAI